MGSLLVVPAAFLSDYVIEHTLPDLWDIGGSVCVISSFATLQLATSAQLAKWLALQQSESNVPP